MFSLEEVKAKVHSNGISPTDVLLLCLSVRDTPAPVKEIQTLAVRIGVPKAKKWNISAYLSRAKMLAIRTPDGWELAPGGHKHVNSLMGFSGPSAPSLASVTSLRSQVAKMGNAATKEFLTEAIDCVEQGLSRAAVVLSWVGAVSVLYDHVITKHLAAFNCEAQRRDAKWKSAKTADDLARMKEGDFLNVLEHLSIIGKSVKQELEGCLKLRNGCGHPNSLKVGENTVAAHVEKLVLNVFSQF